MFWKIQPRNYSQFVQPGADRRGIQQAVSSFRFYFNSPNIQSDGTFRGRRHDSCVCKSNSIERNIYVPAGAQQLDRLS
jgi:hypothetical protein